MEMRGSPMEGIGSPTEVICLPTKGGGLTNVGEVMPL